MSMLRNTTLGEYLERVSSSSPTPGGGGVAAVVASLGASLGCMVTSLTSKKSESEAITALATKLADYRESFLRLSIEDEQAFDHVMAALKLPKNDPTRATRVEETVQAAAQAPLEVAKACLNILVDLEILISLASHHAISDVGAAAHLALAALRASLLNVYINITFMKDQNAATSFEVAAEKLESEGEARSQQIVEQVLARIRQ